MTKQNCKIMITKTNNTKHQENKMTKKTSKTQKHKMMNYEKRITQIAFGFWKNVAKISQNQYA